MPFLFECQFYLRAEAFNLFSARAGNSRTSSSVVCELRWARVQDASIGAELAGLQVFAPATSCRKSTLSALHSLNHCEDLSCDRVGFEIIRNALENTLQISLFQQPLIILQYLGCHPSLSLAFRQCVE